MTIIALAELQYQYLGGKVQYPALIYMKDVSLVLENAKKHETTYLFHFEYLTEPFIFHLGKRISYML